MALHNATTATFKRPSPQATQAGILPAPIKGIDGRVSIAEGNPANCIYTYNIMPSEYGMRVRNGYREWCIGIETAPGLGFGVGTVMPYEGPITGASDDYLFVVTNEGIWDCTVYDTPVLEIAFTDTSIDAGHGTFTQYTDANGDELLFYADSKNGLYMYDPALDAWAVAGGITGPVTTNVNFIVSHKQRLWMVEEDSTVGWYLDTNSISGVATPFYFGNKFRHGGYIAGLYNWSVDGGAGVDDYLVAVGSAGDVIPYEGEDPAFPDTWRVVGTYFIGSVPLGGRCGSEFGGNLHLLSVYGITSMADLLQGAAATIDADSSIAYKIARMLRNDMHETRTARGWEIKFLTSDGVVMVNTPLRPGYAHQQFMYNITTQGWGIWRDLPVATADLWHDHVYFGTSDNRFMVMDINVDGATITPPAEGFNGVPINFSILSNFQHFDAPAMFKRGAMVRSNYVGVAVPDHTTKFVYDYDLAEIQYETSTTALGTGSEWDVSLWDQALWGAGGVEAASTLNGSMGMGRSLAVAVSGKATERATLVSWDVMWNTGGML